MILTKTGQTHIIQYHHPHSYLAFSNSLLCVRNHSQDSILISLTLRLGKMRYYPHFTTTDIERTSYMSYSGNL